MHYRPVHLHPWYRERFGHREGDFPNAEAIGQATLSLPLSPALTDADVADVVEAMPRCSPGEEDRRDRPRSPT